MFCFLAYRIGSLLLHALALPVFMFGSLFNYKWRSGLLEKFGFTTQFNCLNNTKSQACTRFWLHAVSFGEVKTVEPLINELLRSVPNLQIYLSTRTVTGYSLASELARANSGNVIAFHCPHDNWFSVKRTYDAIDPNALIVAETEIWPELIVQAAHRKIPTYLINARLTDRSTKSYALARGLFEFVLRAMSGIFAQSEGDAVRYRSIGAPDEALRVLGNLKIDAVVRLSEQELCKLKEQFGIAPNTIILIGGSTHPLDEMMIYKAFKALLDTNSHSDCRLILAPRHLERIPQLMNMLEESNQIYHLRSTLEPGQFKHRELLLIDRMGELNAIYGLADIAYLGGTWADVGGHNPFEPAVYGLPIFVGCNTYKITDSLNYLKEFGSVHVAFSQEELNAQTLSVAAKLKTETDYSLRLSNLRGVALRTANAILYGNKVLSCCKT